MKNKNSQAIIILSLNIDNNKLFDTLSNNEIHTLINILEKNNQEISSIFDYLDDDFRNILKFDKNQILRYKKLISRSASLSFEIEKLEKKGIYILTMYDIEYPSSFKKINNFPAILYYAGDINILTNNFISIFSDNNTSKNIEISKKIIDISLNKNFSIVTNDNINISNDILLYSLNNYQNQLCIISCCSIIKSIKDSFILTNIIDDKLLLLSTSLIDNIQYDTNDLVFLLSSASVVVDIEDNKSLMYNSFLKCLDEKYTKLFIYNNLENNYLNSLYKLGASIINLDKNNK